MTIYVFSLMLHFSGRPLNLAAMSDLRPSIQSQNRKCCTFRGSRISALHEILQVEETTVKEMDNCKLLKISNSVPIPDGCPTGVKATEI